MKPIAIKLGKVIGVIRQEGLLGGGKRILGFIARFFKMLRKLPGGDILIITSGVGDSALYRAFHVSEELDMNGFKSSVTVPENPHLLEYADSFKIFIFHRVLWNDKIENFVRKIKEKNKEIIFETDDLVFDPKYLKDMDYLGEINALEKKQYEKGIGKEMLRDPYVKTCTATTDYLALKLRGYGKKVFVVPNRLSMSDVEITDKIFKSKSQKVQKSIKLGYFSGTISHNKDFAAIADALLKIMEKYPCVELFLAGPLDIESKFNKFRGRIKQISYAPRKKHFENISRVDINLAPLEIGNPFCEAKSELKFFEAGILGIPTVASATETFKKAISDGTDGFLASDTEEWISKIERLISSPQLRSGMGLEARKTALERYTIQNAKNGEYYDYLKSRIKYLRNF